MFILLIHECWTIQLRIQMTKYALNTHVKQQNSRKSAKHIYHKSPFEGGASRTQWFWLECFLVKTWSVGITWAVGRFNLFVVCIVLGKQQILSLFVFLEDPNSLSKSVFNFNIIGKVLVLLYCRYAFCALKKIKKPSRSWKTSICQLLWDPLGYQNAFFKARNRLVMQKKDQTLHNDSKSIYQQRNKRDNCCIFSN